MILRRSFLTGAASLLFAPAIVRASSLMPIKGVDFWLEETTHPLAGTAYPNVCDRIPVMLNGVIRYLLPDDEKIREAQPLWADYGGTTDIDRWIEIRRFPFRVLSKEEGAPVEFMTLDWTVDNLARPKLVEI